jgi:hypothetical protein
MKTDLQKAALAKLARLSQHAQLSSEEQAAYCERVLQRCAEHKNLSSAVNGVNGLSTAPRVLVSELNLAVPSDVQTRKEFHSMLALAELRIDESTAGSLFDCIAYNILLCPSFKFAVACARNGTPPLKVLRIG